MNARVKLIEYLLCQMELEGIERMGGDLMARRSPKVEDFPLVLLAEMRDGERIICVDDLLPAEVCDQLSGGRRDPFEIADALRILEIAGIHAQAYRFRTYVFPDPVDSRSDAGVTCFHDEDPNVIAFGFSGFAGKVFGIEREGKIISACVSSRQNSKAGEAWVFTHPAHRRKGLAQQVVLAWAGALQRQGLIPFYSHDIANTNSALLARKLNLTHVFDETVIESSTQHMA